MNSESIGAHLKRPFPLTMGGAFVFVPGGYGDTWGMDLGGLRGGVHIDILILADNCWSYSDYFERCSWTAAFSSSRSVDFIT